jgi:hypothetical protein
VPTPDARRAEAAALPAPGRRSEQAVIFTNGAKTNQGSLVSSQSSAIALKVWVCVPQAVQSGPIRGQQA